MLACMQPDDPVVEPEPEHEPELLLTNQTAWRLSVRTLGGRVELPPLGAVTVESGQADEDVLTAAVQSGVLTRMEPPAARNYGAVAVVIFYGFIAIIVLAV